MPLYPGSKRLQIFQHRPALILAEAITEGVTLIAIALQGGVVEPFAPMFIGFPCLAVGRYVRHDRVGLGACRPDRGTGFDHRRQKDPSA